MSSDDEEYYPNEAEARRRRRERRLQGETRRRDQRRRVVEEEEEEEEEAQAPAVEEEEEEAQAPAVEEEEEAQAPVVEEEEGGSTRGAKRAAAQEEKKLPQVSKKRRVVDTVRETCTCCVCLTQYEVHGKLAPRILSCGHMACLGCLKRIEIVTDGGIQCPECRLFTPSRVADLAVPYGILTLVGTMQQHGQMKPIEDVMGELQSRRDRDQVLRATLTDAVATTEQTITSMTQLSGQLATFDVPRLPSSDEEEEAVRELYVAHASTTTQARMDQLFAIESPSLWAKFAGAIKDHDPDLYEQAVLRAARAGYGPCLLDAASIVESQDLREARGLRLLAAHQGQARAQYLVAVSYASSEKEEAKYWMKRAATNGIVEAQFRYAVDYETNKACTISGLELASGQGHDKATTALAMNIYTEEPARAFTLLDNNITGDKDYCESAYLMVALHVAKVFGPLVRMTKPQLTDLIQNGIARGSESMRSLKNLCIRRGFIISERPVDGDMYVFGGGSSDHDREQTIFMRFHGEGTNEPDRDGALRVIRESHLIRNGSIVAILYKALAKYLAGDVVGCKRTLNNGPTLNRAYGPWDFVYCMNKVMVNGWVPGQHPQYWAFTHFSDFEEDEHDIKQLLEGVCVARWALTPAYPPLLKLDTCVEKLQAAKEARCTTYVSGYALAVLIYSVLGSASERHRRLALSAIFQEVPEDYWSSEDVGSKEGLLNVLNTRQATARVAVHRACIRVCISAGMYTTQEEKKVTYEILQQAAFTGDFGAKLCLVFFMFAV